MKLVAIGLLSLLSAPAFAGQIFIGLSLDTDYGIEKASLKAIEECQNVFVDCKIVRTKQASIADQNVSSSVAYGEVQKNNINL